MDWMYKQDNVSKEDYLKGRRVDNNYGQLHSSTSRSIIHKDNFHDDDRSIQVDISRKLQEDPLVTIKKQQLEKQKELLKNSVVNRPFKDTVEKRTVKENASIFEQSDFLTHKIIHKLKRLKHKVNIPKLHALLISKKSSGQNIDISEFKLFCARRKKPNVVEHERKPSFYKNQSFITDEHYGRFEKSHKHEHDTERNCRYVKSYEMCEDSYHNKWPAYLDSDREYRKHHKDYSYVANSSKRDVDRDHWYENQIAYKHNRKYIQPHSRNAQQSVTERDKSRYDVNREMIRRRYLSKENDDYEIGQRSDDDGEKRSLWVSKNKIDHRGKRVADVSNETVNYSKEHYQSIDLTNDRFKQRPKFEPEEGEVLSDDSLRVKNSEIRKDKGRDEFVKSKKKHAISREHKQHTKTMKKRKVPTELIESKDNKLVQTVQEKHMQLDVEPEQLNIKKRVRDAQDRNPKLADNKNMKKKRIAQLAKSHNKHERRISHGDDYVSELSENESPKRKLGKASKVDRVGIHGDFQRMGVRKQKVLHDNTSLDDGAQNRKLNRKIKNLKKKKRGSEQIEPEYKRNQNKDELKNKSKRGKIRSPEPIIKKKREGLHSKVNVIKKRIRNNAMSEDRFKISKRDKSKRDDSSSKIQKKKSSTKVKKDSSANEEKKKLGTKKLKRDKKEKQKDKQSLKSKSKTECLIVEGSVEKKKKVKETASTKEKPQVATSGSVKKTIPEQAGTIQDNLNPFSWKDDEEEREQKRREMVENAKRRVADRLKNLHMLQKKDLFQDNKPFDEDFARRQLSDAISHGTMEQRIRSNIHNIQRSSLVTDDPSFVKP